MAYVQEIYNDTRENYDFQLKIFTIIFEGVVMLAWLLMADKLLDYGELRQLHQH